MEKPEFIRQSDRDLGPIKIEAQWGGRIGAIAPMDGHLFMAVGPRILDVDASDPEHPRLLRTSDILPGAVFALEAVDGALWAALQDEKDIRVFDTKYPAGIPQGWTIPTGVAPIDGIALSDERLYLLNASSGFVILQGRPGSLQVVGRQLRMRECGAIRVSGKFALLAGQQKGLCVMDVSDPTDPRKVAYHRDLGFLWGLDLRDNLVYLVGRSGLRVVDVADPTVPKVLATYQSEKSPFVGMDVRLLGDRAYVTTNHNRIEVFDISNAQPVHLGGFGWPLGSLRAVLPDGDHIYAQDARQGLSVLAPRADGLEVIGNTGFGAQVREPFMAKVGPCVYMVRDEQPLAIVDVSDTQNPQLLETDQELSKLVVQRLAVQGPVAVAVGDISKIAILDVSNPARPTVLRTYTELGDGFDVVLRGELAFVLGRDALHVLDLSTPASPVQVAQVSVEAPPEARESSTWRMFYHFERLIPVGQHHFYALMTTGDLHIIDVTEPRRPQVVGAARLDRPMNLVVAGDRGYLCGVFRGYSHNRCAVLDLSDPLAPREIGSFEVPSGPFQISVHGDQAVVASGGGVMLLSGLEAATHPLPEEKPAGTPKRRGRRPIEAKEMGSAVSAGSSGEPRLELATQGLETPLAIGEARGTAVGGKLLLQAGGNLLGLVAQGHILYLGIGSRVLIQDFTDPTSPATLWQSEPLGNLVTCLAVHGTRLYVAFDEQKRLLVYDVADPRNPSQVGWLNLEVEVGDLKVDDELIVVTRPEGGVFLFSQDPAGPRLLGDQKRLRSADAAARLGEYLILGTNQRRLRVLDISKQEQPALVPVAEDAPWVEGKTIDIQGSFAYLSGYDALLSVIDLSEPLSPRVLSRWGEASGYSWYRSRATVAEGVAYIANDANRLYVLDVSDPALPREIAIIDYPMGGLSNVALVGDTLYTGGGMTPGLYSVRLASEPGHPAASLVLNGQQVRALHHRGNLLFALLGEGDDARIYVFDTSRIVEEPGYRGPELLACSEQTAKVYGKAILVVEGEWIWVVTGGHGTSLFRYDGSKSIRSWTFLEEPLRVHGCLGLAGVGEGLWLMLSEGGLLRVLRQEVTKGEIGTYARISQVTSVSLPHRSYGANDRSEAQQIVVSEGTAFIAKRGVGLVIVDVRDLSKPTVLATFGDDRVTDVLIDGRLAYLVGDNRRVSVVDLWSLANPKLVATIPLPAAGAALDKRGDLIAVATPGAGVFLMEAPALLPVRSKPVEVPISADPVLPRKVADRFPVSLLSGTASARLEYFRSHEVRHRFYGETLNRIIDLLRDEGERPLSLLVGPSGVGKSHLVGEATASPQGTRAQEGQARDGVLMLGLGAGPASAISAKECYGLLAIELGGRFASRAEAIDGLPIVKAAKRLAAGEDIPPSILFSIVRDGLKSAGVRTLVLDNAHLLAKGVSEEVRRTTIEGLALLAEGASARVLLAGEYDLLGLVGTGGSADRLASVVHFPRYRAEVSEEVDEYRRVLQELTGQLPLWAEPDLPGRWQYCYERSLGCVGILKEWLGRALTAALKTGGETLREDTLDQVALSTAQRRGLAEQALHGEATLARKDDGTDLRALLRLGGPAD